MQVTVFGATGGIGSLVVEPLLDKGHTVKVYVRNPDKLPAAWKDRVEVFTGQLTDAAKVEEAIAGSEAVISALGPSMEKNIQGFPLVDGTKIILAAMKNHGVRRFIGHATPSLKDPKEALTFQSRLIGFLGRTMFPRAYKELLALCAIIMQEQDLNWTIIRFTAPNDKPKTGNLRVGFYGETSIGWAVTRGDIAAFTAAQIEDTRFLCRAPAISN